MDKRNRSQLVTGLTAQQLAGTIKLVAATFKPNFGGGTFKGDDVHNLEGGMLNKLWKARALCFSAMFYELFKIL